MADNDPTEYGIDSSDTFGSQPPLILDGAAESTNLSDADPSSGTVSEPSEGIDATIDLSSQAVEDAAGAEDNSSHDEETLSGPTRVRPKSTPINRAPPYRPTRRPPIGLLRVYDDGSQSYEEVRIRKTPFDIGRLDGDLVIPHELQMSRRHLRIERAPIPTDPATADRSLADWTLNDLKSLNGTFVKKTKHSIRERSEVLIGGELVRLSLPEEGDSLSILKVGPGREEEKLTIATDTALIGSDKPKCIPFMQGNLFLDPHHLRLDRDRRGRWTISDLGSTNGLWVRVESVRLEDGAEWQCGEQRFAFFLP